MNDSPETSVPDTSTGVPNRSAHSFLRRHLSLKVAITIIFVQLTILGFSGNYYITQLNHEIEDSTLKAIQLPGVLMAGGKLPYNIISDPAILQKLVGAKIIEAMVIGANGNIFYSLHSDKLGRRISEIPDINPEWFDPTKRNSQTFPDPDNKNEELINVAPIFTHDSKRATFFSYIKIDTTAQHERKTYAAKLVVLGSILCILLTTAIIFLSFRFFLFKRINKAVHFTHQVQQNSDFPDIQTSSPDELGALETGLNHMAKTIRERQTQAENALAEVRLSENRFKDFAEAAADWYWELNSEGRFSAVSQSFSDQIRNHYGSPLKKRLSDLKFEIIGPETLEMIETLIAEQKPLQNITIAWISNQGEIRYARINAIPVFDAKESFIGYRGVGSDITKEYKAALERERFQTVSSQSQKMEALGQMASGMAHEFNNFLTALSGLTRIAQDQSTANSGLQQTLDQIAKVAADASNVTGKFLNFSRTAPAKAVLTNITEVIQGLEPMLKATLRNDIEVKITGFDQLHSTLDATGLLQAIMNMALNARDAMPHGGQLRLLTERRSLNSSDTIGHDVVPGDFVHIAIQDNGLGINDHQKARIFEPYFTTKPADQGTGLGLSIVYNWVKKSGGFIEVESELGLGTCFHLYFPETQPKTKQSQAFIPEKPRSYNKAPLSSSDDDEATGKVVLLVEDDPDIRHGTSYVLENAGFYVLDAEGYNDALAQANGLMGPINLLITDINLNGENGYEIAKRFKRRYLDLKVIYVSGDHQHGQVPDDAENRTLLKPFTPEELVATARQMTSEKISA